MVLDGGSVQPDVAGAALDEQTTAGIDGDLRERRVFDVMVRNPVLVLEW